ncbi:hypothetical protein ARMSODRAFT_93091 [Armillaria solidipes]|uniref:Uncharacterized protein n=1 Tax=Armillaria solidipes TaxID=1076256 RepID=A0A2H3BPF8_9AGAR|nr:hypothetical protein ARMSODRAFT_93091 [Armillaria solidipes]
MSTQSFVYPAQPKLSPRDPKLGKAQLTNSTDGGLRLQPIVWAICSGSYNSSLKKTISLDGCSMQLSSYWCIGYTPLILASNGLQICSISGTDHHVVSPWSAVNTYLYLYAVDEFPEPKDSPATFFVEDSWFALYPKGIPSIDSLFGTVIRSIRHHTDADSFKPYGDIPSFNQDGDQARIHTGFVQ